MVEIARALVARAGVGLSRRVWQVHGELTLTGDVVFDPDHLPQPPAARVSLKTQPAG